METINVKNELISLYDKNVNKLNKGSVKFINDIRANAIKHFKNTGIPTIKNNYKYPNLEPAFRNDYIMHFVPQTINVDLAEVFQCDVPELNTHVILLINGWYADKETPLKQLPEGAVIGSFAKASEKYPEIFKKYYSRYTYNKENGLVALNTAFAQDGIFLYIPRGVIIEKPIQIINLIITDNDLMIQPRNLIVLEENAQAKVIICDHTLSPQKSLTNSVTEITVNENAIFDYYNIQNEHNDSTQLSSVFVYQKTNSRMLSNTITLHGGLVRNNIYVLMDDEGCESNIYGLYLVDKEQHIDNYTYIDHAKPNCTSNELYKGILDDSATGAFLGHILVRKDAQNTNAFQSNKNILLTSDAKMNTKPQLEIYADNVKCGHGATVGQLDENALFYMRTRGIAEKEARMLLMYAFANEIISKIRIEPLKERIDELIEKRLRGEFSRCNCCPIKCG